MRKERGLTLTFPWSDPNGTYEIAAKYQVHPTQVTQWRRQLIEQAAEVFAAGKPANGPETPEREALLAKIGQLTVERDFLSRALGK